MSAVVADTHAAVWYLLNSPLLSAAAQAAMDRATNGGNAIYVSAISLIGSNVSCREKQIVKRRIAKIRKRIDSSE